MAMALSPQRKTEFINEVRYLLWKHPHIVYVWGSTSVYDKNSSDCSGLFFAIGKKLGWGTQRTTAYEMEKGSGGWKGKHIALEDAEPSTIVWWSGGKKKYDAGKGPKPTREHGHIGVLFLNPRTGLVEVVHNNLSHGLHIEPLQDALLDDLSSTKNLTLGEKEAPKLGHGIIQTK